MHLELVPPDSRTAADAAAGAAAAVDVVAAVVSAPELPENVVS